MFQKLVSPEYCCIVTLQAGDTYAVQDITRTDSLSLLMDGTLVVYW